MKSVRLIFSAHTLLLHLDFAALGLSSISTTASKNSNFLTEKNFYLAAIVDIKKYCESIIRTGKVDQQNLNKIIELVKKTLPEFLKDELPNKEEDDANLEIEVKGKLILQELFFFLLNYEEYFAPKFPKDVWNELRILRTKRNEEIKKFLNIVIDHEHHDAYRYKVASELRAGGNIVLATVWPETQLNNLHLANKKVFSSEDLKNKAELTKNEIIKIEILFKLKTNEILGSKLYGEKYWDSKLKISKSSFSETYLIIFNIHIKNGEKYTFSGLDPEKYQDTYEEPLLQTLFSLDPQLNTALIQSDQPGNNEIKTNTIAWSWDKNAEIFPSAKNNEEKATENYEAIYEPFWQTMVIAFKNYLEELRQTKPHVKKLQLIEIGCRDATVLFRATQIANQKGFIVLEAIGCDKTASFAKDNEVRYKDVKINKDGKSIIFATSDAIDFQEDYQKISSLQSADDCLSILFTNGVNTRWVLTGTVHNLLILQQLSVPKVIFAGGHRELLGSENIYEKNGFEVKMTEGNWTILEQNLELLTTKFTKKLEKSPARLDLSMMRDTQKIIELAKSLQKHTNIIEVNFSYCTFGFTAKTFNQQEFFKKLNGLLSNLPNLKTIIYSEPYMKEGHNEIFNQISSSLKTFCKEKFELDNNSRTSQILELPTSALGFKKALNPPPPQHSPEKEEFFKRLEEIRMQEDF